MQNQNNFDALRLFGALCVLISHQYALSGLSEPRFMTFQTLGGLGVYTFFILSGYLVSQSWASDPCVWRFCARRMLRIWPALAVVIAVSALLVGPLLTNQNLIEYYSSPLTAAYFRGLYFYIQYDLPLVFPDNHFKTNFNGSLWTIPHEVVCYFTLIVLGVTRILGRKPLLLAVIAIPLIAYAVVSPRGELLSKYTGIAVQYQYFIELSLFFFAGAILFNFDQFFSNIRNIRFLLGSSWLIAILFFYLDRPLLATWAFLPLTIIVIGRASTPILKNIGNIGDFSYGIYIYAWPVQQILISMLQKKVSWEILLLLTLVVTTAISILSWLIIEKPALSLKPAKPTNT